MSSAPPTTTSLHRVRPRWVWGGLLVAVLGLLGISAGVVELSWDWVVPGVVLLLAGAAGAAYGGVLSDSRTGHPADELAEVRRGGTREGAAPGAEVHARRAEEVSRTADATRRELLEAAHRVGRPNLSPVGAGLALLTCGWLLVAQWTLYPMSVVGQAGALRDLGVTIVVGLAALRVAVAGPRRLACAVVVVGGLVLALLGLLAAHRSTGVRVDEVVCGVVLLAAGVLGADRGGLRRAPSPPS